jgi:hypothetical protein
MDNNLGHVEHLNTFNDDIIIELHGPVSLFKALKTHLVLQEVQLSNRRPYPLSALG